MSGKKESQRQELANLRAERDQLKDVLRRIAPGFRAVDRRDDDPDGAWKAVDRLLRHLNELAWLSDPTRAAVYDSSRGGERPIYPGVLVTQTGIRHAGSGFQRQLLRIVKGVNNLVDRSEDWVKGIDQETAGLPQNRRPRCGNCGGEVALVWRYCATCGHRFEASIERLQESVA